MTNAVHGSQLSEEQINEISDVFNGDFRGRMILSIETTDTTGEKVFYRFVLRPGNTRSLPFDKSGLQIKAQCLDGTTTEDDEKLTTTVVGWDPRIMRFVFVGEDGIDMITPPVTDLVDIHSFSSIRPAA